MAVYDKFREKYFALCREYKLEQYIVPYLMSSHPGSTPRDAVELSLYLKSIGLNPEQVQDFYPTPGTISTVMYYTGLHPMTGKKVSVTTDYREKQLQRALLQYSKPENANLVREALRLAGREDLIGNSPDALIRPAFGQRDIAKGKKAPHKSASSNRSHAHRNNVTEKMGYSTKKGNKMKKAAKPIGDGRKIKKSKLERVFGEDALRIQREAEKLSEKRRKGKKKR